MSGILATQDFDGTWDVQAVIVAVCAALSIYNCTELILLIFTTFQQRNGLYFWSLVVASFGSLPYCVGFLLEYYGILVFWAAMIFSTIGWVMLITGQAFVLYSRLGLIVTNARILIAVKLMIIFDAGVFHPLSTIIWYCSMYGGSKRDRFAHALYYTEKIQMTAFCVQEFVISGIYLWKTVQLLKCISKARAGTRRIMWELFAINVIIIVMDIALLALEYSDLLAMERAFKSVIYSIKLKLEFAVLGRLVDLVQSSRRNLSNALADVESYVDTSMSRTNTHPSTALMPSPSQKEEKVPDWITKLETSSHVEYTQPRVALNQTTLPFITVPKDFCQEN